MAIASKSARALLISSGLLWPDGEHEQMNTKIFHYEHLLQELPIRYLDDTTLALKYRIEPGYSHPLGAIPDRDGVNFSVFADRATSLELLLFDHPDDLEPVLTIQLDPIMHKTFHFWHVFIRGLQPGKYYAYRVNGWQDLYGRGDRYAHSKVLIDPYARGNSDLLWNRVDACGLQDNLATSMRSVIVDTSGYDWEGDQPLKRPMNETIIYEMHVRGFTRSSSSHCRYPGTFAGVIEKIPYLQELGITAVELLPIFDFDQREVHGRNPLTGGPLVNYWGYDPVSFFAPEGSYCTTSDASQHINEFRDLVKALHRADIEVILDVVFNHTSEGNHQGPIISFKGFANSSYYLLSPWDRQYYMDYSGCGNTLNCNHPVTEKFIADVLEYWVTEMHVDGFRFDEAVILTRDESGFPVLHPPVVWQIELSEVLADTKLIAEAWDAAGLYEVGYFPGYRWGEWNGRYRDVLRSFMRGDHGYREGKALVGRVADVIAGSADIFEANDLLPINSVNFITAHDGFTLNDLVSYNYKHNEANGEGNRDGNDENLSWNCGWEGPTEKAEVEELRERQIRNFAAILMVSQGVPMFVAGDEMRRSQQGNNNAYCQDNEVSWLDWSLLEKHHTVFRFFKELIAFRKRHSLLQRRHFFSGQVNSRGLADISWHGCRMHQPGWYDPASRVLAFTLGGTQEGERADDTDIHVIINMEWEDLDFDLPPLAERHWYRVLDSALPAPHDIVEPGGEIPVENRLYCAKKHSVVVLISR
jgi:isoamylase